MKPIEFLADRAVVEGVLLNRGQEGVAERDHSADDGIEFGGVERILTGGNGREKALVERE